MEPAASSPGTKSGASLQGGGLSVTGQQVQTLDVVAPPPTVAPTPAPTRAYARAEAGQPQDESLELPSVPSVAAWTPEPRKPAAEDLDSAAPEKPEAADALSWPGAAADGGSGSGDQVGSRPAGRDNPRTGFSPFRFNRLAFLVTGGVLAVAILLVGGGILLFNHAPKSANGGNGGVNNYSVGKLPIGNLKPSEQLQVGAASQLSVNGLLKANNTLVLTPGGKPTSPVTGQFYYDKNDNTPYYYDGTRFVSLAPQQDVTSIGGSRGAISLGNGLSMAGGQLAISPALLSQISASGPSAPGVTSLQGQTGDVTLAAGSGISINGTSISNAGMISLVSGSSNLKVTSDGAGHYIITDLSSAGTVTSITGTANQINVSSSTGAVTLSLPQDIATTSSPSFKNLKVGLAGTYAGILSLTNGSNANLASIYSSALGQSTSYVLPDPHQASVDICLSTGNCAGTGGGVTASGGTAGSIAKFTGSHTIADSGLSEAGSTLTYAGNLIINADAGFSGNLANLEVGSSSKLSVNEHGDVVQGGTLSVNGTGASSIAGSLGIGNGLAVTGGGANIAGNSVITGNLTGLTGLTSSGPIVFSGVGGPGVLHSDGSGTLTSTAVVLGADTTGDYIARLGTLTGLSATGNTGGGSTPALAVLYGAVSGTAVQGNTTLTCPSGSGNLTGGGDVITLGAGGTCGAISITDSPTFTGGVTVGAAGTSTGNLILANGTNSFLTTLQGAAVGQNQTIVIPDSGAASDQVCLVDLGNCAGSGGGVTGTGTTGTITMFNGSHIIGNSIITQTGTSAIGVGGDLTATGTVQGKIVNAAGSGATLELNGVDINAAGTLTNVAYLNAENNDFTGTVLQHNGNDICDTSGNCANTGGGVTTSGGTANTLAMFTGSQTLGDSILSQSGTTISVGGGLDVQGSGGVTVGVSGAAAGVLSLANTTNANMSIITALAPTGTGDAAIQLPSIAGGSTDTVCLVNLGNCAGSGGGVTGSGTANTLAMFTGSGSVGDSIISQSGTTVTVAGDLTATALQGDGSAITNLDASNLTSGTVPSARISGAYGGLTGTGALISGSIASGFGSITTNNNIQGGAIYGGGNGAGIAYVYGQANAISGYDGVIVGRGFSGQTADMLELQNASGTVLAKFDASGNLTAPTINGTTINQNGNQVCDTSGNCAGVGGGVTTSGGTTGTITMFNGSQTIGDSILSQSGTTISVGGNLSVGGSITGTGTLSVTAGGTNQNLSLNASGSGTIGIGGASTGNILLGGGQSGTGCTLTNSTGDFYCAGTIKATNNLQSVSGSINALNGNINATRTGAGLNAFTANVSGDTGVRYQVNADGEIQWGDGTGTLDTNLYRAAANQLQTDDSFNVVGSLTQNGTQVCLTSGNCSGAGNGGGVTYTGAANYLTKADSGGNLVQSQIYDNGVEVGIGVQSTSGDGLLQLASGTTAANGIGFGTDTNLYRASASQLQTDGAFNVVGSLTQNGTQVCLTSGNCAGAGGGVTTSGGTTNTIAMFTGSQTLGDSILSQSGTTINVGGDLTATGTVQGATLNGTGSIELNGADINTGGTLANVAYLDQSNTFSQNQTISAGGATALQLTASNAGITFGGDTDLYRGAAGKLQTDNDFYAIGGIDARHGTANQVALGWNGTTTAPAITFGSADDTNLYRSAAAMLKTDGSLTVVGTINGATINGTTINQNGNQVCDTSGNCAGVGGGVTTSGGTNGTIAMFTGSQTIGDSILSQSGTTLSVAGDATLTGDLAVNGGDLTASTSTFNLLQSAVTTLNIGAAVGSGGINLAGGSSSTGCTVDGSTGNLACTGSITSSSGGVVGYWSRSGTNLQPANSGDSIITSGNITTNGTGVFNTASSYEIGGTPVLQMPDVRSIFVGAGVGTSGVYNAALGYYALHSNTAASNTAVGYFASESNTTGTDNVAVGATALQNNSTGNYNVGVGFQALQNTTASYNVGIGAAALASNVAGSGGIALGYYSLYSNTSGNSNVAIGLKAGYTSVAANANTTGSQNTYLGYEAGGTGASAGALQNATAIGAYSAVGKSNALVLGCTGGVNGCPTNTLVGIDTTTPANGILTIGTDTTTASGGIYFGDDTNLYRGASGQLNTDGAMYVNGNLGVGGYVNSQTIGAASIFTGTVAVQGANALTLGTASSHTGAIVFDTAAGTHTITLQGPSSDPGGNYTLSIPTLTSNDQICTVNLNNCTGIGGGGTAGTIALFTGTGTTVGNSMLTQSVSTLTAAGNVVVNAATGFSGNLINLEVNGTSKLSVDASGNSTQAGTLAVNGTGASSIAGTLSIGTLGTNGTTALCSNAGVIGSCASTGSIGFWNRTGTTLQPANAGDNINTTGAYQINGFNMLRSMAGHSTILVGTAGNSTLTGVDNVAIGGNALVSATSGAANVAVGTFALQDATTGSYNVALGYQAGWNISTGSNNIMIGNTVAAPLATSSNQLNIGNAIYGDLSSGNVWTKSDSSTAFQVQNAAGTKSFLTVDTTGDGAVVLPQSTQIQLGTNALITENSSTNLVLAETSGGTYVQSHIFQFQDNYNSYASEFTIQNNGQAVFQNAQNSTMAFQIQNKDGGTLLQADTTSGQVNIGYGTPGANGSQTASFSMPPSGGGILGAWQSGTALPTAVYGAASAAYNGYIYNVGGNNGSGPISTVYYAPLNASTGAVGAWTNDTSSPLPTAIYNATSVAYNGYLYIIGGDNGTNTVSTEYYAPINSDGSLGSWSSQSNIPALRELASSAIYNGKLYLLGGYNSGGNLSRVDVASFNTDGSLTWNAVATADLPAAIAGGTSVVSNGYIYEITGSTADHTCTSAGTSTVYVATINSDGSISSWSTSASLVPDNRFGASAVAWGSYIYLLGGTTSGGGCSPGYLYHGVTINSDGTLGTWGANNSTHEYWQAPAVAYNGYIYILGGTSNGTNTTATVDYASASGSQGYNYTQTSNTTTVATLNLTSSPLGGTYTPTATLASSGGSTLTPSTMYYYKVTATTPTGPLTSNEVSRYSSTQTLSAPSSAPTAAVDSSTSGYGMYCNATYPCSYEVTYITANGGETTAGPASNSITSDTAYAISLTNIPIGPPGTVERAIYVSEPYYHSGYAKAYVIADNTTTSIDDRGYFNWTSNQSSPPVSNTATYTRPINLSWPAVNGATNYSIYRGTSSGGENILVGTTTSTSYSDTGGGGSVSNPNLDSYSAGLTVNGTAIVQAGANNTGSVLQVQDSAGNSLFSVNNANNQVVVGQPSATPTLLVLGTKNTLGDPTCVNGGMYYNSSSGQAKICLGGSWAAVGVPTVTTLPSSPSDGDEVYYRINRGDGTYGYWHLRYNASTTYWDFLGGPSIKINAGSSVINTGSSTYSTNGSAITTAPLSGDYDVQFGDSLTNNQVSNSANDMRSVLLVNSAIVGSEGITITPATTTTSPGNSQFETTRATGVAAGQTIAIGVRSLASVSANFYGVYENITPIRVK